MGARPHNRPGDPPRTPESLGARTPLGQASSRPVAATAVTPDQPKELIMGIGDKLENLKDNVVGSAKEALGKATDNEQLEAEGKIQDAKGDLSQAGEKVKDAFN